MKNKKPGHISEGELDNLLNEAFLDLDFEASAADMEMLDIVAGHEMRKRGSAKLFYRLNTILFLLSLLIFLNSSYRYIRPILIQGKESGFVHDQRITRPANVPSPETNKMPTLKDTVQTLRPITPAVFTRPAKPHPDKITTGVVTKTERNPSILSSDTVVKALHQDSLRMPDAATMLVVQEAGNRERAEQVTDSSDLAPATTLPQKNEPRASTSRRKDVRPVKTEEGQVIKRKARKDKRKRGRVSKRGGTFKMKGHKYKKSR